MKLDVTCTVCSVSRMHGAGYGWAGHMCSRGESLGSRGFFFFLCAGDVMAACTCVRGPAGGSNSLPDGSVHVGRGTCSCVTSRAGPACAADNCRAEARGTSCRAKCTMCECRAGDAQLNLKRINLVEIKRQTSLSGEHDFPGQGCKTPCCRAQDIPLVRGPG